MTTTGITDELEVNIGDAVLNREGIGEIRAGLDWGVDGVGILHEASWLMSSCKMVNFALLYEGSDLFTIHLARLTLTS